MYKPLRSSETSSWDESSNWSRKESWSDATQSCKVYEYIKKPQVSTVLLALSLGVNVILGILLLKHGDEMTIPSTSDFARLERNIPRPWSLYHPDDEADEVEWANLKVDLGNIALDDDYARRMGLPRSERFPWDRSKGIYLINGYHNLHCLKILRASTLNFRNHQPQTTHWHHVLHCYEVLKEEILCNADDTPRYTGYQPDRASGLGQVRMCRDWKRLEEWSHANTACWRYLGNSSEPGFRELDRYRFCPDDSPWKDFAKTAWIDNEAQKLQAERVAQAKNGFS